MGESEGKSAASPLPVCGLGATIGRESGLTPALALFPIAMGKSSKVPRKTGASPYMSLPGILSAFDGVIPRAVDRGNGESGRITARRRRFLRSFGIRNCCRLIWRMPTLTGLCWISGWCAICWGLRKGFIKGCGGWRRSGARSRRCMAARRGRRRRGWWFRLRDAPGPYRW